MMSLETALCQIQNVRGGSIREIRLFKCESNIVKALLMHCLQINRNGVDWNKQHTCFFEHVLCYNKVSPCHVAC